MIKYIVAAIIAASPVAAQSQPDCAPSEAAWETLRGYDEQRQSFGLSADGRAIIETWGSEETGTWTILVTTPTGMSCILAHGSGFNVGDAVEGDPA